MLAKCLTLLTAVAGLGLAQNAVPDFVAGASYPTGGSSSMAVVADFNGDGLPDLVTVESVTQSLSLLLGRPGGTFAPLVSQVLGFGVSSIVAADFNGDGKADLAFTTGTSVAVLLNTGAGVFAPAAFYSAGIAPNYIAAADLNRDGILDVAVAGSNGFAILLGTAGNGFSGPLVLPQIVPSFYLILADFNNDGNVDLLGDTGVQGQFYAGHGDGTFAAPVATLAVPFGTSVADFNLDGKLDLVSTITQQRQHGSVQAISIASGVGDGSFLSGFELVLTGASIGQPVAGDFNGDGKPDVAVRIGSTGHVQVYPGNGNSTLSGTPSFDSGIVPAGVLMTADADGNHASDLLLLSVASIMVIRNTHGNPPLLAQVRTSQPWVTGGAMAQATVTLGGPAPAGGAVVKVASSNPSLAFPTFGPSVTIPTGASSASFSITTSTVTAATPIQIAAAWNSVKQTAVLNLVAPYSLTGLSINPASQFGIFTAQGVVTLSGPADANAAVSLVSGNPAVASVPATVTVPAGASSAAFAILLRPVAIDTPVAISASMSGVTQNSSITILKPLDKLAITKSLYTVRQLQFHVEATSTSATATLTAYDGSSGLLIGTLQNAGGGKYNGTFTVSPAVLTVTLKSSLGGTITGAVTQK